MIIDDIGQMVGWHSIGFDQDDVILCIVGKVKLSVNQILAFDRFIRVLHYLRIMVR